MDHEEYEAFRSNRKAPLLEKKATSAALLQQQGKLRRSSSGLTVMTRRLITGRRPTGRELVYSKNKLLKKVNLMELSEHILKDAQQALATGLIKLPWQIPSAPAFFLANKDDQKVMAFGSVMHNGVYYKVGVKRE
ncbi:hypothetical protein HUU62_04835 [Rhodoferax sp. 4810]|nr:hypothetical protein [Rhodoferax jenense]